MHVILRIRVLYMHSEQNAQQIRSYMKRVRISFDACIRPRTVLLYMQYKAMRSTCKSTVHVCSSD